MRKVFIRVRVYQSYEDVCIYCALWDYLRIPIDAMTHACAPCAWRCVSTQIKAAGGQPLPERTAIHILTLILSAPSSLWQGGRSVYSNNLVNLVDISWRSGIEVHIIFRSVYRLPIQLRVARPFNTRDFALPMYIII